MKNVFLALLFCASAAQSQVYVGLEGLATSLPNATFTANEGTSFTQFGGATEFDISYSEGGGFGFLLGWFYNANWRSEIEFRQLINDLDEGNSGGTAFDFEGELVQNSVLFNTWLDFDATSQVRPYLGAGVGYGHFVLDSGDLDDESYATVAQFGMGVNVSLNHAVSISMGYRYLLSDDLEFDDFRSELEYEAHSASAGLRYTFGTKPAPTLAQRPRPQSRVPSRPQRPVVAAPRPAPQKPLGSITRCYGPDCRDADRDTVLDIYDFCPNTRGGNVMNNGCGVGESTVLQSFEFSRRGAEIAGVDERELIGIARVLRTSPNFFVEIRGYTKDAGEQKANIGLSKARALAVKDALIAKGVNGKQLVTRGYGAGNLVTGGARAAGYNRIELLVLEEWGNRPVVATQAASRAPSAMAPRAVARPAPRAVPPPAPNKPVLRFKEQR